MLSPVFLSYAVDAEDVVLHRALGALTAGSYVEVDPPEPDDLSPTRALADAGWRGVLVTNGVESAPRHRPDERIVVDLAEAAGALDGTVHLAVVPSLDVARGAVEALTSRPWVLLVRDAAARGGELPTGYLARLAVGGSVILVDEAQDSRLGEALSRPADSRDRFERASEARLRADLDDATRSIQRWRAAALAGWPGTATTTPVAAADPNTALLAHELAAVKSTLSWRITRPLRMVSGTGMVMRLRGRR